MSLVISIMFDWFISCSLLTDFYVSNIPIMFVGNLCIDALTINIIDWVKILIVDFMKCWEYFVLTR